VAALGGAPGGVFARRHSRRSVGEGPARAGVAVMVTLEAAVGGVPLADGPKPFGRGLRPTRCICWSCAPGGHVIGTSARGRASARAAQRMGAGPA